MDELQAIRVDNDLNLPLYVLERPQFNQTYAVAMVDFGSIDSASGQIPAGSAHFLEHKLFAKQGFDSSQKYAQYGASSNAFTSYTKTAYLFKTVGQVENNLGVLLDLISEPYFTADNVQKEREIIGQEIQMYADMPEWVIEQVTLNNLYPQDALGNDIAGDLTSISQIDAKVLLDIYQTYYVPDRFRIYLAGSASTTAIQQYLTSITKQYPHLQEFAQRVPTNAIQQYPVLNPVKSMQRITFKAQRPHLMFGLRIDPQQRNLQQMIILQNQLELLFELILGDTATFHEQMVGQNLIDDSFSYSVIVERHYSLVLISMQTDQPEKLAQALHDYLFSDRILQELLPEKFVAVQRDSLGSYLFAQNYMENLALESAELNFYGLTYQQMFEVLSNINLQDLLELATNIFQEANLTTTYLEPKK
ncbi:EF-P 5-aminopentanol modification-associated protein YfmH [Bombilactobacillus thymidiniphilus]|uniref:Insulinase family protein n=1 Tax=Bombilactobacillus thymidiniphilus TaxID=2923363 RepID=A0ABY4PC04_9LACO|nr:pitrilysin family protein [Bombilactobacillus thymidiniphilus]UQS83298.1 insulinase family protein [Bombilactobacillus thymidiniphilus]